MKQKHIKRENYKTNKRHKQIKEKFTDLQDQTIETVTEEKVFTKCVFACIGAMRKHVNTIHECSLHSDIGAKHIKFSNVQ